MPQLIPPHTRWEQLQILCESSRMSLTHNMSLWWSVEGTHSISWGLVKRK